MQTIIDRLYTDNKELIEYLTSENEISFKNNVEEIFRKTLLLAVASFLESNIQNILIEFFEEEANSSKLIINFIKNKAISRQYHTYFSWKEGKNANTFFSLFGSEFKDFMSVELKENKELEKSIKEFLKLGNSRNELVHENFASYALQSTSEEIYTDYKKAMIFIEALPKKLREYAKTMKRHKQISF